jgi:CheY-like chemotaxis protein
MDPAVSLGLPSLRVLLFSPHSDVRAIIDQLLGVNELGQVLIYPTFVDLYAAAFTGAGELAIVDSLGTSAGLEPSERDALGALRQIMPTIFLSDEAWAATSSAADLEVTAVLRKPLDPNELMATIQHAARLGRSSTPTP